MFSPDQFTHILPPSIWCITMSQYYLWGTTFIIRNQKCYGKTLQKVHLSSGLPDLTSYHSWPPDASTRGVHLTEGQPDPKADQTSSWHDVVLLLQTRFLYWGPHLTEGQPEPRVDQMSSWPDLKANQMSSWPDVVPLLLTRCLYQGDIWLKVSVTQRLTKCQADLM